MRSEQDSLASRTDVTGLISPRSGPEEHVIVFVRPTRQCPRLSRSCHGSPRRALLDMLHVDRPEGAGAPQVLTKLTPDECSARMLAVVSFRQRDGSHFSATSRVVQLVPMKEPSRPGRFRCIFAGCFATIEQEGPLQPRRHGRCDRSQSISSHRPQAGLEGQGRVGAERAAIPPTPPTVAFPELPIPSPCQQVLQCVARARRRGHRIVPLGHSDQIVPSV